MNNLTNFSINTLFVPICSKGKETLLAVIDVSRFKNTPLKISVFLSLDNKLSSTDVKLFTHTIKNRTSFLRFENPIEKRPISSGAYQLIVVVESHPLLTTVSQVTPINSDVILQWISVALNSILTEGQLGRGIGPTTGTRLMAILSAAMYDTVCGFNNSYEHYKVNIDAPVRASMEAAVIGAASKVLTTLIPNQKKFIDFSVSQSLSKIRLTKNINLSSGFSYGQNIADQIINLRLNDGSENDSQYLPPSEFGYYWRPGSDNFALGPKWGSVKPFALNSVDDYLPKGLDSHPDYNSIKFKEQIEEVREYGGLFNTSTTTLKRTADQTEIANFWAYDRPDTYRPYGQLIQIAVDLAIKTPNNTIEKNASLFAALNVSLADSVIAAWKVKYTVLQPRPFDVITGQVVDKNQNPITSVVDAEWKTLLSQINGTQSPPFPDYISGHSAMGGVFATVMTEYFGEDRNFEARSMDTSSTFKRIFTGFIDETGVQRNSFYQAGLEDALSRVYGGVHIREACEDSFTMGLQIGDYITKNFFNSVG